MSEPDYNLLDERWIPVLLSDGAVERMGIREAFSRAAEIVDLACELPSQRIAIERILLAICYRVIDVPDLDTWMALWDSGVPEEPIQEYLDRWEDRFFLFGGRRPFMQAPGLRTAKDSVSGLEKIVADVPNGEPFFTMRTGAALETIPPDEAAIWLIHAHAFDPAGIRSGAADDPEVKGGKGYPIGPSWTGQLGLVWLKGGTLDESLILNLVAADHGSLRGPASTGPLGACSWESDDIETGIRRDYSPEGNPDPDGYAVSRLLTWHSRRVRLVGDRSGVTGVVLAQGDKLGPQNMQRYEPMSLWRYSSPQSKKFASPTYMPRKHEPGRAFWRALPGVLPFVQQVTGPDRQSHTAFLPSETIQFHKTLDSSTAPTEYPVRIRVEAVGMAYGSNESVIDDIYHDEVTMATALLQEKNTNLYQLVVEQVEATESAAQAIGLLAANISRACGERGDGAGDGARDRAKTRYFALVDDPFRVWLSRLESGSRISAERAAWRREIRRLALMLADELLDQAPPTAINGRDTGMTFMSTAKAENIFRKALNAIAPIEHREQKGEQE
ncbi:type I-E CRISPR-associated protein Cse1/CasA [Actinomyces sp. B33]|uniref:type I-E CRISPR-associated protein Cse1/CasA n=1 Tax=Actinomyces sp. B33 TaxID=2942131 RepID=UPI0023428165|nr:type I-E CRISPR-associated protein Cse1/CasA [Actinomyces sp. B33]MDC4232365.1 type I-E CRISPR-associated protein Cse1/CasA [Actinomyces sp. B33]